MTVTVTAWLIDPLTPVTVIVYMPVPVEPFVLTVRTEEPVGLLEERVTGEMLDNDGLFFVIGVVVALNMMVPANPPRL